MVAGRNKAYYINSNGSTVQPKKGEEMDVKKVSYIWVAEQSEPGMDGKKYAATATAEAPAAIKSKSAGDRIVYAESVYGEWTLLGTAKGGFFRNEYGTFIELETPAFGGSPVEIEEVARCGWYKKA